MNGHTIGFHPQTQKLEQHTKLIVQYESTAEEVSFEWSHHRIFMYRLKSENFIHVFTITISIESLRANLFGSESISKLCDHNFYSQSSHV